jgi:hypothetical protein
METRQKTWAWIAGEARKAAARMRIVFIGVK